MADRNALSKIGLLFMATTLLVMMTGAVVVADHLSGRLTIECAVLDDSLRHNLSDGFRARSVNSHQVSCGLQQSISMPVPVLPRNNRVSRPRSQTESSG